MTLEMKSICDSQNALAFINERLSYSIELKNLLCEDGTIWISIDDDEHTCLKVFCDDIFGRENFVANVIWEKKYSLQNDVKWLFDSHDFILAAAGFEPTPSRL